MSVYRQRFYRIIFGAAAFYNLAFGCWAGFFPHSFFEVFHLPSPLYPAIWQCLGMVIGLYGLLYAYAARKIEAAWPIIAVGLLGKVLGPIGWTVTVAAGDWPVRTFPLIVFNDLVWWVPFAIFLLEGTAAGKHLRDAAPSICAALHALAAGALLLALRPGTEVNPDVTQRVAYITAHPGLWRGGWLLWIFSGMSLLGFYAWWGARLPRSANLTIGPLATLVAAVGFLCDAFAESLYIGWLPAGIDWIAPLGVWLTAGVANGLYTLGGILLTVNMPSLAPKLRATAWFIWLCGIGMSLAAFLGSPTGLVITSALLFPTWVVWCFIMGRRYA